MMVARMEHQPNPGTGCRHTHLDYKMSN